MEEEKIVEAGMEELDQIIEDYLKAKDTDYAIMINGDWGCGKSYYIKHGFRKTVTSVECPKLDEKSLISSWDKDEDNKRGVLRAIKSKFFGSEDLEYEEEKYYPFYISLYGVASVTDFNLRIQDEFWGLLGKGTDILNSFLKGKYGASLPMSAGKLIPHNAVLVFDDLERICLDKISPIEVLGLINTFSEHRHLKVVIVCNEEAFRQKSSDGSIQLKLDEEYQRYKEKTIRFTYTCKANVDEIYSKFAHLYEGDYGAYLEEEAETILDLFGRGGKGNIRTLKFFIESYEKVFNAAYKHIEDYSDKILNELLYSMMIYVMEYKDGHSDTDLKRLCLGIEQLAELKDIDNANPFEEGDDEEQENVSTYDVNKARTKYLPYYDKMVRAEWLIDYICTGALNESDVKGFVKMRESEYKRLETSPAMQAVEKFKHLNTIEDEEVEPTINQIWGYIESNQYSMSELLNIYELFAGYAKDGLEIVSLPIEKDAVFEKAIANCSNIDESLAQKISAVTSRLTVGVRVDDYEGRYNHLVHCAQEAAAKIDKQAYKSALEEFLNTIEEEDAMVEGVAEYRDGAKKDLSLRGVDWNRVYQAIIKQPNPKACMIIDSVNHMIGKDAQTWSQVEYRALDAFRADLQRFAREHKSLPRIVSIWRLVKSIQQFLKGVGVY